MALLLRIRRAVAADAAQLSAFAAAIFRDTFGPDNKPSDIAKYIGESFTVERQAAEIEDPNSIILFAEFVDNDGTVHLAGYAHLLTGDAPPSVEGPAPIELGRFYVSRDWHGRGVAQALMNAVYDAARERDARTIWLGVWEHNPRAIAFYRKCGFEHVGDKLFMLGTDLQTDWVLVRHLPD